MLLRLAYLGVTHALSLLRPLPMTDHAKDVEILALRHQITVLERQLHGGTVRFTTVDWAFLALRKHETHYNTYRPHRGIASAAPLRPLPQPMDPGTVSPLRIHRHDRLGGLLHEYQHAA